MANLINDCKERNCIEGGSSTFERNNYFCGKLMVDRDFRADQLYHMAKQRLHNTYLHGWGTVCGLMVVPHPNCPNLRVVVNPGFAIDCWGREIFVAQPVEVILESYGSETDGSGAGAEKPENLYICLCYMECETEPVPVFLDECGCSKACEPNRIRETFLIDVLTNDHFGEDELDGYKNIKDKIKSFAETDITIDTKWSDINPKIDGTIKISTMNGGTYEHDFQSPTPNNVKGLLNDINDNINSKVEINPIQVNKFEIEAKMKWDIILLEETGDNPFFSAINIPAFNTDKGNKIIQPCPECSHCHIVLAEIKGYKNVDNTGRSFLDPTHPNFKEPAYTVDNFSYRKILPSVDLINRLMIYHTFKK